MLEIYNGRDKFYQWDVGQKLIVDENIIAVQYDNGTGDALVCGVYEYEGKHVADVPNIMLQTYWAIKCYAYCGECVRAEKVYEVEKRSRPDDYIYTETETLRYSTLFDMLTDLEAKHNEEMAAVVADVAEIEADVAANSERISTNKVNIDVLTKNIDVWRDGEIERHNQQQQQINKNKSDIYKIGNDVEAIRDVNLPNVYNHLNMLLESTNKNKASINELNSTTANLEKKVSNNTTYIELLQDSNNTLANFVNNELDTIDGKIENHENRITTLEKRPTGGGGSGTASDVDWNENDETSPAYIKNRTHYEEYGLYEVLPESKPDALDSDDGMYIGMFLNTIEANIGQEYTITYNGTEYKCVAVDGATIGMIGYVFGNYGMLTGGTDTGEPFIIMALTADMAAEMGMGMVIYLLDGATDLTLKIETVGNVIHKIDDKYINFKQPNWDAMNDEEGYIANRTHYTEHHGSYELNYTYTVGKDSIDMGDGMIAYKVSNRTISENAIKGISFQCYTSDNPGEYITIDAAGSGGSYKGGYEYKNGSGNEVGVITVYDKVKASMALGYSIPSNGTYLYSNKYEFILMSVPDVVNKIDKKYLDLTNYYTKDDMDKPYERIIYQKIGGTTDTGMIPLGKCKEMLIKISAGNHDITGDISVGILRDDGLTDSTMLISGLLVPGEYRYMNMRYYREHTNLLIKELHEPTKYGGFQETKKEWVYETSPSKYFNAIQVKTYNGVVLPADTTINVWGVLE